MELIPREPKGFIEALAMRAGFVPYDKKDSAIPSDVDEHELEEGVQKEIIIGSDRDFENTYKTHVWVYTAIDAIAQAASKIPVNFLRIDEKGKLTEDEDRANAVARTYAAPNPFMSTRDLTEAEISYLQLTGNAYTELVHEQGGTDLMEMYPLQSSRIKVLPDRKRRARGYIYTTDQGRHIPLPLENVMHTRFFHPTSDFYGLSPIDPCSNAIITDQHAINYNKNFYVNSARPDGVLETDSSLTNRAWRRIVRGWKIRHKSVSKAHRLAILEEGLKYKQIAFTQKDMDFLNQRKMNRGEILSAFRVPPVVVGLLESEPFSTAQIQKKMFYEEAVLPALEKFIQQINTTLLPVDRENPFAPRTVAVIDLAAIEELKEDKDKQASRLTRLVRQGVMKINEARADLGLEKVSWGDTYWAPANMVPIGDSGGSGFRDEDILKELNVERMITAPTKEINELIGLLEARLHEDLRTLGAGNGASSR